MYVGKKETIQEKRKRELTPKQNKTHTYIKKKKRERMVPKIKFFLEKQDMKQRGTKHYANEKEKENVSKSHVLQRGRGTVAKTLVIANKQQQHNGRSKVAAIQK